MTTSPIHAPTIDLTDRAVRQVQTLLRTGDGTAGYGLRIGVTPGGCAGLSYSLALAAQADPDDVVLAQDGFDVFVHRTMSPLLRGVRIDFVESLTSSGFTFDNPNAANACGCGTSFAPTDGAHDESADLVLLGQIEQALEDVRPYLRGDGGDLDVVSVADGVVTVRLTGACGGCSMASATVTGVIEKRLRDAVPGIRRVVALT